MMNSPEFPGTNRLVIDKRPPYPTHPAIYGIKGHPELLARKTGRNIHINGKSVWFTELDNVFAEELIKLEGQYHITNPGFSQAEVFYREESSSPAKFNISSKVYGHSLATGLDQIPQNVARQTYASIIRYHQAEDERLVDLRPSNCMFGHTAEDPEDKVYFTDLDPLVKSNRVLFGMDDNPTQIMEDFVIPDIRRGLEQMAGVYGQSFDDLQAMLTEMIEQRGYKNVIPSGVDRDIASELASYRSYPIPNTALARQKKRAS